MVDRAAKRAEGKGIGYDRWAAVHNLKQMAATVAAMEQYGFTPEELDAKRAEIANFQYDASTRGMMRNSLTMPKEEVDALIAEGKQYVVRFKIEPNEDVRVNDLIRGEVIINSSILDDKVLYKSADELPTYHLANIVDDHLMEVSPCDPWGKNGCLPLRCTYCCTVLSAGKIPCRNLLTCLCS